MRLLTRLLLVVCMAGVFPGEGLGQVLSQEYQLKAMYLRKIPSFVEWPPSAANARTAAFQMCTVGDYPFGLGLAGEVRGVTVGGRKIVLRRVHKEKELAGCEVIFFRQSDTKSYAKILEGLKGKSVLTVGESEDFLEAGGMVRLGFENGRLQMEVNLVAVRSANLKVDARLLVMANRVVTKHIVPGG